MAIGVYLTYLAPYFSCHKTNESFKYHQLFFTHMPHNRKRGYWGLSDISRPYFRGICLLVWNKRSRSLSPPLSLSLSPSLPPSLFLSLSPSLPLSLSLATHTTKAITSCVWQVPPLFPRHLSIGMQRAKHVSPSLFLPLSFSLSLSLSLVLSLSLSFSLSLPLSLHTPTE